MSLEENDVLPPADEAAPHVPTGADYASDRTFADLPLSAETAKALADAGFITATPVQSATIEPALAGRDLIVRAKTGTGKTLAFCIPIVERITDGERQTRAIILAPTRELANQTGECIEQLLPYRDLSHVVLVGGMPMGPQEKALEAGPAIVTGTPGRILDHLRRGNLDLSGTYIICLDEADEMLSMGFYEDVNAILDKCPKESQKFLFSATISPETQKLVERHLHDPEQVQLSTDGDNVEGVEHMIYEVPAGQHRVRSLLYLIDLEDPASAIIFVNTREDASTVASFLDRQGLDVQLMSGELPQVRRNKVMAAVKRGEVRFLVATDVAARGIDISDLSHVIQYNLPQDPAVYLHRTGRTGRIGKKGRAVSLVGGTDLQTKKVLETQHRMKFQEMTFPTPEACVARRVDRQAAQIRDALGSIVFEAYLPTAKALLQRPDAEVLIAATLRAFFQWDRRRRAEMAGDADEENGTDIALSRPSSDVARPLKNDARRDGPPPRRKDGERRDERPRGREERPREARSRDDRPPREPRRDRPVKPMTDDLDSLLQIDDVDLIESAPAAGVAPPAEGAADADAKKKKRRRRKKKSEGSAEGDELSGDDGDASATEVDDLDALLSME